MSSIETRTNGDGTTRHRVRFRHQGANRALTFATRARAERWSAALAEDGYDAAMGTLGTGRPQLDDLGCLFIPKPGKKISPNGCHVYLLYAESNYPVYIGATTNYHARIGRHLKEKTGMWSRYSLIECRDETTMWEMERRLIDHYRPDLNIAPGRSGWQMPDVAS